MLMCVACACMCTLVSESLVSMPQPHEQAHPDVDIVTGAIDEGLTESSDVYPGLGDPGNRFFGTV